MSVFDPKEYSKNWYLKNRERVKAKTKTRYFAAKEAHLAYHRQYRKDNADAIKIRLHDWYIKNRHRVKEWAQANRQNIRDSSRRWKQKIRNEMLAAYGNQCTCCAEKSPEFLTLEHINRDGTAHRKKFGASGCFSDLKKRGWPTDGYTILCMNCNWAIRFGGTCPHKQESLS